MLYRNKQKYKIIGDARQAISEAQFLIKHLKEKEKVIFENIF